MPKNFSRFAALTVVASLALAATATARADVVPITFSGTAQTFSGGLSAAGSLQASGTALFLSIPNQTIPVSLNGTPSIASNPVSSPLTGTTVDLGPPSATNLVDINSLDLDILNGQTTNFAVNTLNINATPFPVTVDLSGTLTGMTFTQSDPAVLATILAAPSGSNGTFSVGGDLTATLSNLVGTLGAFGTGLASITIGTESLTTPFALAGTWAVTPLGLGQRKVVLEGSTTLSVPLSLVTSLVSTASTVNLTVNLNGSINVAVGYHLEAVVVPEPGSVALLGLGLVALVPVIRRCRKK